MNAASSTSLLVVLSGPSGTGKTSLCNRLVEEFDSVRYSVSCTTRPPRPGERDGEDYIFTDEATFEARIEEGAFLEHARVHDYYYGTLRTTVYDALAAGRDVLMDIDVQGAAKIRDQVTAADPSDPLHDACFDVFIAPPSIEHLHDRLTKRGQDEDEVIRVRLNNAAQELSQREHYRYLIVNDDLEQSYHALRSILLAEHHRVRTRSEAHAR